MRSDYNVSSIPVFMVAVLKLLELFKLGEFIRSDNMFFINKEKN